MKKSTKLNKTERKVEREKYVEELIYDVENDFEQRRKERLAFERQ